MNTALQSKITVESLRKAYSDNNYALFEKDDKDFNLNIFGVRSEVYDTDTFNDIIGLYWKFQGVPQLRVYSATTDPGSYYFKNPMSPKGTHIMKAGQYRGAYAAGLHQGKYGALVQVGPIDFWVDNEREFKFKKVNTSGPAYIGANIHADINIAIPNLLDAPLSDFPDAEAKQVYNWSAACQVHANPRKYLEFMTYVYNAKATYGNKFTYTLLEESDSF